MCLRNFHDLIGLSCFDAAGESLGALYSPRATVICCTASTRLPLHPTGPGRTSVPIGRKVRPVPRSEGEGYGDSPPRPAVVFREDHQASGRCYHSGCSSDRGSPGDSLGPEPRTGNSWHLYGYGAPSCPGRRTRPTGLGALSVVHHVDSSQSTTPREHKRNRYGSL